MTVSSRNSISIETDRHDYQLGKMCRKVKWNCLTKLDDTGLVSLLNLFQAMEYHPEVGTNLLEETKFLIKQELAQRDVWQDLWTISKRSHEYHQINESDPEYNIYTPINESNVETRASTDQESQSFEQINHEQDRYYAEKSLQAWCANSLGYPVWMGQNGVHSPRQWDRIYREMDMRSNIKWRLADLVRDARSALQVAQRFAKGDDSERHSMILGILPDLVSLSMDGVGMTFVQKCFELSVPSQQWLLGEHLSGSIMKLSLMATGCRVVQSAIETREVSILKMVAMEIDGYVIKLLEDQNGNHVLQKFIECAPLNLLELVVPVVQNKIATFSMHSFGCRVVQRLLERRQNCGDDPLELSTVPAVLDGLDNIAFHLIEKAHLLAHNQFGNYVVQHIFTCGTFRDKRKMLNIVKDNLINFSTQKFACNVVEKALQAVLKSERQDIILASLKNPNPPILKLMSDRYGNYVAQRMLEIAATPLKEEIIKLVQQSEEGLLRTPYGRHMVNAVQRIQVKDPLDKKNSKPFIS